MKKNSVYLLSAMVVALFVIGGGPCYEASANGLTLTSPNGGEEIPGGSTYEIEWVTPPEMVRFNLKFSINNGKAWKSIKSGITVTSYDWQVPTPAMSKNKCLVKVMGYNAKGRKVGADRSDAPFTVLDEKDSRIAELETRLTALEEALASVLEMAPYVSVHTGTINGMAGPHVIFTGVNVHVRSGYGSTNDNTTGLGNLIVGYNEEPPDPEDGDRAGSHNIIIGRYHRFSSYGGLVAGFNNTIGGPYSSVSAGFNNTASNFYSSVSGGANNEASSVGSSVSGGNNNKAIGDYSSVSGGGQNTASGIRASVSGGSLNDANGMYSSVSGGVYNEASNVYSSVSGGESNTASGTSASVSGGYSNEASGIRATVSGGQTNNASTHYSSVSGGFNNEASGNYSSVSGGRNRTAAGDYDWVAGGLTEDE